MNIWRNTAAVTIVERHRHSCPQIAKCSLERCSHLDEHSGMVVRLEGDTSTHALRRGDMSTPALLQVGCVAGCGRSRCRCSRHAQIRMFDNIYVGFMDICGMCADHCVGVNTDPGRDCGMTLVERVALPTGPAPLESKQTYSLSWSHWSFISIAPHTRGAGTKTECNSASPRVDVTVRPLSLCRWAR
uniref:Uncharacterized protein n=1 Tax=Toxoplasma gondii (strain ATCC 50861 / VEG) TaxID=432359 RepID=A0A0F7V7Y7_TOXGV|nr:TPA: hypothetical protein BN1205_000990 [Toxoplasma gondii VEG]